MKQWQLTMAVLTAFALGCVAASTQDPVESEARAVLLENDRVVVKEVVLEPGVEYPEHHHARPHVGVIIRGGTLEFYEGGATERVDFEAGQAGWRDAGVTHRIVNRSETPVHVVEVELK